MPRCRKRISAFVFVLLATGPVARVQAAREKPAPPDAAYRSQVDALAESVFKDADKNHNNVLNKHEYANADEALQEGLVQFGTQGVIGKPLAKNQTAQPAAALAREAAVPNASKVSPAEFKAHAQAVAQQADQYFRELNAMSAAQQKAMMSRGRRGGRFQGF